MRVYNFCLYRLRDRQEAEDAVQTTFLYAYGSLRRGVVPRAEVAWLLTIAKNVCVARWRSARRRSGHEVAGEPERLELVPDQAQPDPFERQELERALGRLPEQQRLAILLREWQGLSYAEIAERLEITVPAVESLLFRARHKLADELRRPTRRRRGLDLGSLLAGLKSLLGGAAIKVAVATVALTAGGVMVGHTVAAAHHVRRTAAAARVPLAHSRRPPAASPSSASVESRRRSVARTAQAPTHRPRPVERTPPPAPAGPTAPGTPDPTPGSSQTPQPPSGGTPSPQPATPPVTVPAVPAPPIPVPTPPVPAPPVSVPPLPGPPSVPGVPQLPLP